MRMESDQPDHIFWRTNCRLTYDRCADITYGPATTDSPECAKNTIGDKCNPYGVGYVGDGHGAHTILTCPEVVCAWDLALGNAVWKGLVNDDNYNTSRQPASSRGNNEHRCFNVSAPTPAPTFSYAMSTSSYKEMNQSEVGFRCSSSPFVVQPGFEQTTCLKRKSFCHPTEAALTGTTEMRKWEACPINGCPANNACMYGRYEPAHTMYPGTTSAASWLGRLKELNEWRDWYDELSEVRCSCQPHTYPSLWSWHKKSRHWPYCSTSNARSASECTALVQQGYRKPRASDGLATAVYWSKPVPVQPALTIDKDDTDTSHSFGCSTRETMIQVRSETECYSGLFPRHFERELLKEPGADKIFTETPNLCMKKCASHSQCVYWVWSMHAVGVSMTREIHEIASVDT